MLHTTGALLGGTGMLPDTSSQKPGAGMWLQESHGHALRPQTTRPCSHNRLRGEPPTQAAPILLLLGMLFSLGTPPMGKRPLCQITVQTPSTHVASSLPAESQLVCSSDSQTAAEGTLRHLFRCLHPGPDK